MYAGLDADRVVEVIVTHPGQPSRRRGSGYLVTDNAVLTAEHVIRRADSVRIRARADQPGEWTADGAVVWSDSHADAAVVAIVAPASAGSADPLPPVRFGRVEGADGKLSCSLMGFPLWKLRDDPARPLPDGRLSQYRDSHHEIATTTPWANLREGTLSISVQPPDRDPDPARSPWEGMSGAAVWGGGCIIGLVGEHHRREGTGRLAATRIDRWYTALTAAQIAALGELIGLPSTAGQLVEVKVDRDRETVEADGLDAAVRAVLEAECRAPAQQLHQPYRFLRHGAPGLDRSYVQQQAVPWPEVDPKVVSTDASAAVPIPLAEALAQHRHVLIEGEPGAGKSTFTIYAARELAAARLEGRPEAPTLPGVRAIAVRVPARDLTGQAPLSSLVRTSVAKRFGAGLGSELPAGLFETKPDGTPWLLLADGLDEIVDQAARQRVVDAIAADTERTDSPYRWVVTTRALPARELDPLRRAGLGFYMLSPFDEEQLRAMAAAWLADPARPDMNVEDQVDLYLARIEASGLGGLVRVPLLAAITLIVYRRAPGRSLPASRPGVYHEFTTYLLRGREGEADRQSAVRYAVQTAGGSELLADWLHGSRLKLLTHLARQTLSSDLPPLSTAVGWTNENAPPESTDFLHGWPETVGAVLAGTGLLVFEGADGELRWIHRSFAEYLVARETAAGLPAHWPGDDPDRDGLLRDALESDRRDLAVLTIACWAGRDTAAAQSIIRLLMRMSDDYGIRKHSGNMMVGEDSSRPDHEAALAGRLLAEGISVPEPLADQVLLRLLERARSLFHAAEFCVIVGMQPQRDAARAALLAMADDSRLTLSMRCGAVVALGRIFGYPTARSAAAPLLGADGPARAQFRTETGTYVGGIADGRVLVGYHLAALGKPAHRLVRELLDLAHLPADDSVGRILAAECALSIGEPDRAAAIVAGAHVNDLHDQAAEHVAILLRAGHREAAARRVDDLFDLLDANTREPSWIVIESLLSVARLCLGYDERGFAADIAQRILSRPLEDNAHGVYDILAYCDEVRALEVFRSAEIGNPRSPRDGARDTTPRNRPLMMRIGDWQALARALWSNGHRDDVIAGAERALTDTVLSDGEVLEIARLLVDMGDDTRAPGLVTEIARDPAADGHTREEAVRVLQSLGLYDAALDALRDLARRPTRNLHAAAEIARKLALAGARQDALEMLRRILEDHLGRAGSARVDPWQDPLPGLRALFQLSPVEGRTMALALARESRRDGNRTIELARILLESGDAGAAGDLLRRVATGEDEMDADIAVRAAELLDQIGDSTAANTARRRVLTTRAAADAESYQYRALDDVVEAATGLEAAGCLGPRECDEVAAICAQQFGDLLMGWGEELNRTALAELLARNHASDAARTVLHDTIEARARHGGTHPRTIRTLLTLDSADATDR